MVAPSGQAPSKKPSKGKGKNLHAVSQAAEANRRRASAAQAPPSDRASRDSTLLKRKYGRSIGARYDGTGRLIPADYMSMSAHGLQDKSGSRPPKKRRSQRDTRDVEVMDEKKSGEDTKKIEKEVIETPTVVVEADDDESGDESDESDDEEWEEVDLESQKVQFLNLEEIEEDKNDNITISLDKDEFDEEAKTKRKRKSSNPAITREDRENRKLIHKIHLAALVAHVAIRNKWCSDFEVRKFFRSLIPDKIKQELHPQSAALSNNGKPVNMSQMVMTRKLLDGLRHLMELWKKQFRVKGICGLRMTSWTDIFRRDRKVESKIDKRKFVKLMKKFRGSRDVGAQGFCALLRAADVDARLVCSLQPLDFSSNAPIGELTDEISDELNEPLAQSEFPVYWVEVWDMFSEKWIAIDPVVLGIVEPASIHRKSKLEPPMVDKSNMLRYVIAFDDEGFARDVTRRYAYYFNAKTRKKRITNTPEGAIWYSELLACHAKSYSTDRDNLEDAEMESRSHAEQIPSSIQDFKGHPLYVPSL